MFKFLFGRLWRKVNIYKAHNFMSLNSSLADCDLDVFGKEFETYLGLNSSLADCDMKPEKKLHSNKFSFKFLFGRLWQILIKISFFHNKKFKFLFGRLWLSGLSNVVLRISTFKFLFGRLWLKSSKKIIKSHKKFKFLFGRLWLL